MGRPARHARHHRGAVPDAARPGPRLTGPGPAGSRPLEGALPSPNIWRHPATYELENRAFDPEGRVEAAMRAVLGPGGPDGGAGWSGRHLLDLGCGTGFHLPRWAADAARVTGVEPHPDLVALARRRVRALGEAGRHVSVLPGTAQAVPLPDGSVDVLQARWSYFFGPGCEPGLAEVERVLRRGGTAFVLDNDAGRSTFGGWFGRAFPAVDPDAVAAFWSRHGWEREALDVRWSFARREDLEAVVRIELDPATADAVLADHAGTEVDYAVNLWWKRA